MPVYNSKNNKLEEIIENHFKLESELQKITEHNLDTIFNLEFVSTEFSLNNLRVDTLAFDRENNSFVILEYKRNRSLV
ncbi:MAG: hypothetical protein HC932_01625 [Thermales bacterium]|nr:hypothetical protein [Thermales bacterium]